MSGMTRRDVSTAQLMKTHGYSARTDYHKDKQDAQAVRELAREILRLTRSTLLIHMRFLESALVRFVPGDETVTPEMATDGKSFFTIIPSTYAGFSKPRRSLSAATICT